MILPILRKSDLLYMQTEDGEYVISQKGFGVVETLGYDEPSPEFEQGLRDIGFVEP